MEESELLELGLWDSLNMQLQASATRDRAALPPPPPPPPSLAPEPKPQVGWRHAVWKSPPHAPPIQVHLDWLGLHRALDASTDAAKVPRNVAGQITGCGEITLNFHRHKLLECVVLTCLVGEN
jgi:hypothetical protein